MCAYLKLTSVCIEHALPTICRLFNLKVFQKEHYILRKTSKFPLDI